MSADKLTLQDLLTDARKVCVQAMQDKKPVVAMYKAECNCGDPECKLEWVVTLTPFTDVAYSVDGSRRIQ